MCPSSGPHSELMSSLVYSDFVTALCFKLLHYPVPLLSDSALKMEASNWSMLVVCHALVVGLGLPGVRSLWKQESWLTLGWASDLVRPLNRTYERSVDLSIVDLKQVSRLCHLTPFIWYEETWHLGASRGWCFWWCHTLALHALFSYSSSKTGREQGSLGTWSSPRAPRRLYRSRDRKSQEDRWV